MMPITKQTIAIIGSSSLVGTFIAKGLCRENYRLLLVEKNGEEAKALSDEICTSVNGADVEFSECTHQASWEADVIFIVYQEPLLKQLSEKITDVSAQKIVAVTLGAESRTALKDVESLFPNSRIVGLVLSESESESIVLDSEHASDLNVVREMLAHAGLNVTLKELVSGKTPG
ncbi:MAG: hypothetical protein WEC12_05020 [Balneolaceae bacterium]